MIYDVGRIRAHFPALARTYQGRTVAYLDGPGGSQVVQGAMDAMLAYMAAGGANLHGVFPSSTETEDILSMARRYVAALLGAQAGEVAFGANMTTLNLALSRALARTWAPGDEIVVTELDHRANVDPWLMAAADRGVRAHFLPVDPETLTLDLSSLDQMLSAKTKVVAVGLASNAVGTITDVRRIADRAHGVGAIVVVDAVHAAPHLVVDRIVLGADVILCSAYKFFGPHVGAVAIDEKLFRSLRPYKLRPAPEDVPDKLETGTQNHEGLAGVVGALGFVAGLGTGQELREQLISGIERMHSHESQLASELRSGLRRIPGVRVYAAADEVAKTPTIAFRVDHVHPRAVCQQLLESQSIFIADGDFYASTLAERLGVRDSGGWVRAGLAPYTTQAEVQRLLEGVEELVRAGAKG